MYIYLNCSTNCCSKELGRVDVVAVGESATNPETGASKTTVSADTALRMLEAASGACVSLCVLNIRIS